MKKTQTIRFGFTIVELLLSLVILALLMTAVAVAFNASIKNYQDNESISKTINTARAALMRITNDIRTAEDVAVIGGSGDPDNLQCGIYLDEDSYIDICYRFDSGDNILYLDEIDSGNSYVLCRNVTAMTFDRAAVPGNPNSIRNVRISMTVTDDQGKLPQTLVTAAVVRRNL